jgi:hypothetical protein
MNEQMTVSYQIENEVGANWAVAYNGTTLINADLVKNYLNFTYGDFLCIQLYYKFITFNSMQAADLEKALTAWNSEYNPISNYDKHETNIDIYNHGDNTKTTHSDPDHNTITTAATNDAANESYITTFDSDTPRKESETKIKGGTITTNDNHVIEETVHTSTTMANGETTLYGDEIRKHENITQGNIGVTTSQQMILSEVDMRLNPVIKQYLDRFVYTYCIYIGGAWD